jgi:hypothetical protein
MALNLPKSDGGNRTPIIKYDARAGRIFRVDRTQEADGWDSKTVEITPVFQAVFDMENIELGWLYFPTNDAPSIIVAKYGQPLPDKPSKNHRAGFRVHMLLGAQSGGDVREMAANAQVSIKGMDALHDAYLAGLKEHPGQLPVVKLDGTEAVQSSGKDASGKSVSSQNYMPRWSIFKWIPRPSQLPADGVIPAEAEDHGQAETAAAKAAETPAAAQQPVTVEDDF